MKYLFKILIYFACVPILFAGLLLGCKSSQNVSNGTELDFSKGNGATIDFGGAAKVKFEWIYPSEKYTHAHGQVKIELKVSSSKQLTDADFKVFRDDLGAIEQGKAGEVSLTPLSKEKEYIYTTVVPLNNNVTRNALYVRVLGEDSPVRFFDIADQADAQVNWIDPNPAKLDPPLYIHSHTSKTMKVSWEITSISMPRKQDIVLHLNEEDMPLSSNAEIVRLQSNQYRVTDILEIKDPGRLQTLYAKFAGARSTKLKFKYVILGKPNLYIISIGPETDLQFTKQDADDFANLFKSQGGVGSRKIFDKVEVFPIIGDKASPTEIKATIETFQTKYQTDNLKANDLIMVFISSHGFMKENDFFIQATGYRASAWKAYSISYKSDIIDLLDPIPCKKVILIDACHSGGAQKNSLNPLEVQQAIKTLNKVRDGFVTITSSSQDEFSYEDSRWRNGAFTEALVKGLRYGHADRMGDNNRIVTLDELYRYLKIEVPALVKNTKRENQNPQLDSDFETKNLPIYVVER
ncbi:MAG: caspase family protein [Bacteroidia bacterium]|nr:caspase family protein [Bacteroidia bacterium]